MVVRRSLVLIVAVATVAVGCESDPDRGESPPLSHAPEGGGAQRVGFGYKTAWLAVKTTDGATVVQALRLRDVTRVGWGAVDDSYDHGVFVTPPVGDWTLAVSVDFADPPTGPDIATLSGELNAEVQFFVSHRIVELQGWASAIDGNLRRQFVYLGESGEIVASTGEPTPVEHQLGIPDPGAAPIGSAPIDVAPNEDTVMTVAEAWSLDPTRLSGADESLGWFGSR